MRISPVLADTGRPQGGGAINLLNAGWTFTSAQPLPDGSYALQTSNGANFVTALGGGGQVQVYEHCDPGFPGACIDGVSDIFQGRVAS